MGKSMVSCSFSLFCQPIDWGKNFGELVSPLPIKEVTHLCYAKKGTDVWWGYSGYNPLTPRYRYKNMVAEPDISIGKVAVDQMKHRWNPK